MEYHRISFIHDDTEYSFIKAMNAGLTGYAVSYTHLGLILFMSSLLLSILQSFLLIVRGLPVKMPPCLLYTSRCV